jgi:hypothetical protein
MTRRVTLDLPDDVAAYLDSLDDPSAEVARALLARMHPGAAVRAQLAAAGFDITDEGLARARGRLPPFTPEQKAEIRRRRDMLRSGTWPVDDPGGSVT